MAKEILLYGGIYSSSVERFIEAVNELKDGEDLVLRVNTLGGSPEDMTGMIAKFQEFKGKKIIKVDGKAYSSGAFFLLYADSKDVEMTSSSKLMIHRAGYPARIESDKSIMTDARWEFLAGINKNLRSALEARVDSDNFKKITGVSIDEIFSTDSRIDVFLDAEQSKELGLVGRVNNISPARTAQIAADYTSIAAQYESVKIQEITPAKAEIEENKSEVVNKKGKMTIGEIKSTHPEAYGEIMALGVSQEKDRAGAWSVFAEIDAKRVKEGIKSGESMSETDRAEFSLAASKGVEAKAIEAESQKEVETKKVPAAKTEAEIEAEGVDAFFNEVESK